MEVATAGSNMQGFQLDAVNAAVRHVDVSTAEDVDRHSSANAQIHNTWQWF